MFVRWQSRKRQRPDIGYYEGDVRDEFGPVYNRRGSCLRTRKRADGSIGQDVRWTAVIVESVRVDGKPRSRHVAWLASITESRIDVVHQRRYFWDQVFDRLDHLGNRIPIEDRRRTEAAIALKVPRLSRAEHDASIEDHKRWLASMGLETPEHEQRPYRPPLSEQNYMEAAE